MLHQTELRERVRGCDRVRGDGGSKPCSVRPGYRRLNYVSSNYVRRVTDICLSVVSNLLTWFTAKFCSTSRTRSYSRTQFGIEVSRLAPGRLLVPFLNQEARLCSRGTRSLGPTSPRRRLLDDECRNPLYPLGIQVQGLSSWDTTTMPCSQSPPTVYSRFITPRWVRYAVSGRTSLARESVAIVSGETDSRFAEILPQPADELQTLLGTLRGFRAASCSSPRENLGHTDPI